MPIYPEIKPNFSDLIETGDGHRIYVERCGREGGIPVIFLHGGPGSSTNANHRRYFDPKFFDICLFDQRGCGQSLPRGSTENNTTQHLIQDVNLIRKKLGLNQKAIIFGGSWGSALAIAYAAAYGESIEALVLRGIFLGSSEEVLWFTNGLRRFMPEAHKQLMWDTSDDLVGHYYERVNANDISVAKEACRRWLDYEIHSMTLGSEAANHKKPDKREVTNAELARARVQLHYLKHSCFFEKDELLKKAVSISKPAIIVQGGMDMICPPITAYRLHEALPDSKLNLIATGGHGSWQSKIAYALSDEMELLKKRLQAKYGD